MKSFIHNNFHIWESNSKILVSDESIKKLSQFSTIDEAINYLFLSGQRECARELNKHWNNTK